MRDAPSHHPSSHKAKYEPGSGTTAACREVPAPCRDVHIVCLKEADSMLGGGQSVHSVFTGDHARLWARDPLVSSIPHCMSILMS